LAHSADVSQSLEDSASRPRAHITFIHGIANKPAAGALLKSWIAVLAERGGVDLAALRVSASMVYWADVLYAEPWVEFVAAEESLAPPPTWQHELPLDQQVFVESLRGKLQWLRPSRSRS
jgi:hypothetical protein